MPSFLRVVPIAALSLFAGCYHNAEFERETPANIPVVADDAFAGGRVRIEVLPFTGGTQYEKHAAFLRSLRDDPRVELLGAVPAAPANGGHGGGDGEGAGERPLEEILADRQETLERRSAGADYVLLYSCEVEATASGSNFLLCFPGFLIFAPAWHGLEWSYPVVTRVDLCRGDGARVAVVEARDEYSGYYTSISQGINTNLGFTGFFPIFLFGFIFPFTEGITTSVAGPDNFVLDQAFTEQEGKAYGDAMKARVLATIAADLKGELPPADPTSDHHFK